MKKINTLFILLFLFCFICAAEEENTRLPVNVPEEGVSLSQEYPGSLGQPLYQPTFSEAETDLISGDQEIIAPPKEEHKFESTSDAMKFGLKRGFANITLFWLEIPRNLSYEFTARPLSAIATAPFLALGLGGLRAIDGVIDIVSLGYNGYFSYGSLPDFPWEGEWVAKETDHY